MPTGVKFSASEDTKVKLTKTAATVVLQEPERLWGKRIKGKVDIYSGTVETKTSEIFMAVDADSWQQYVRESTKKQSGEKVASSAGRNKKG